MSERHTNWAMIGVIVTLALQTVGFVWFMSALNSQVLFIAEAQAKAAIEQKELAKIAQIHDIKIALLRQKIEIIEE